MPMGPGKYDHLCTQVREGAKADGAIVIVINGEHGSSFCVQASPDDVLKLPKVLREIADEIDRSLTANA